MLYLLEFHVHLFCSPTLLPVVPNSNCYILKSMWCLKTKAEIQMSYLLSTSAFLQRPIKNSHIFHAKKIMYSVSRC